MTRLVTAPLRRAIVGLTGVFVAVTTTGIYCRPFCPAPTPRRENVRFFQTAAAAQEAGFRPCLRSRPETAPELAPWRGESNTVARALRMIEAGALDTADVEALAMPLGLGARQLRRLFKRYLGASPIAVAQTRRILLAKQLLQDTQLPMAEVALAAGFGSIRRFNETFQQLYKRPPRTLRRTGISEQAAAGAVVVKLGKALTRIAPGKTLAYGALAAKLGRPRSVRVVGLANAANPISLVVPCHRVIGADGSLTGYGGGLERRRWLLKHEGASFRENRLSSARPT